MVKVLDMGLARFTSQDTETDLTGFSETMGTVDFMAPEQALNAKKADHRADIYSLGVTLWYLIHGRVLYPGTTITEKLLAHRELPIPRLTDSGDPFSEALDGVFQRMVQKNAEHRFGSMTEVVSQLESLQQQSAVEERAGEIRSNDHRDRQSSNAKSTALIDTGIVDATVIHEPSPVVAEAIVEKPLQPDSSLADDQQISTGSPFRPGANIRPSSYTTQSPKSHLSRRSILIGLSLVSIVFLCAGGGAFSIYGLASAFYADVGERLMSGYADHPEVVKRVGKLKRVEFDWGHASNDANTFQFIATGEKGNGQLFVNVADDNSFNTVSLVVGNERVDLKTPK